MPLASGRKGPQGRFRWPQPRRAGLTVFTIEAGPVGSLRATVVAVAPAGADHRPRHAPETDPELEQIIAELIAAKNAAPKGSAEYLLAKRQLAGLRFSYEMAGPIMEDLDPFGWGATSLPDVPDPEGKVLPLQRPRRRT
jgi:hypothetical protein